MHLSFLFAAFAVVWLGLLIYVVGLARRSRELENDIQDLRAVLEKHQRPEG